MKYEDPELINRLSAEYVLGTMRGRARQRFQRLMLSSPKVRQATWEWEQQLNKMATEIAAVPPDTKVWDNISRRIDPAQDGKLAKTPSGSAEQEGTPSTVTKRAENKRAEKTSPVVRFWQTLVVTAIAASLVLVVYLLPPILVPESEQLALVKNEQQQMLWLINVTREQLNIRASSKLTAPPDKDYELWMIIKGQEKPVSLGLLPKTGNSILVKAPGFSADDISLLAVSLEPIGGSPDGVPTQVLYTTPLISL